MKGAATPAPTKVSAASVSPLGEASSQEDPPQLSASGRHMRKRTADACYTGDGIEGSGSDADYTLEIGDDDEIVRTRKPPPARRASREKAVARAGTPAANASGGTGSGSGAGSRGGKKAAARAATPMVELPEGETAYWIDGLTVPLRHYQYEALLWMVHEETADNGMLRGFWSPFRTADGRRFFFSPHGGFCRDACLSFGATLEGGAGGRLPPLPTMTRGCMLADEMGLGKTIESVALILCNPRVSLPGSRATMDVGSIAEQQAAEDRLQAAAQGGGGGGAGQRADAADGAALVGPAAGPAAKYHGGTLVVCMVSLVGQWIEEINSKLTADAHLGVYCYHGSNRKKDPKEIRVFNKIIRVTDGGLELVVDPRHAGLVVRELGIKNCTVSNVPGSKATGERERWAPDHEAEQDYGDALD